MTPESTLPSDDDASGEDDQSVISRLKDLLGASPGIQLRNLTSESDFSLEAEENVGKYVVEREIGRGGMGRVFLAFDRDLRRRVAIKVVAPELAENKEHLARFVEEAQVTGQLEHPGIPPVHELALDEQGTVFFTLKLLKGRTLKDILRDLHIRRREARERYSRIRLLMILQSVCNAVHFAHEKGVVHRDIKPENIMIGDYGEVQLMDWGLAKVLDAPEREPLEEPVETLRSDQGLVSGQGRVYGTLQYMAPEQATPNEPVDRAMDVYSLGATLYEILTYVPPRTGKTITELLEECRMGLVIEPSKRAPKLRIPEALEEICLTAMELRPDDRYHTAVELAETIQNYIDGSREEERRRAESERFYDDAKKILREHRRSLASLVEAQRLYEEEGERAGGRPAAEVKRRLRQLGTDVGIHESQVARKYTDAQTRLAAALSANPENEKARRALGELYLERLLKADTEGNNADVIFYGGLIEQVNDGHFDKVLRGDGSVDIQAEPTDAKLVLRRFDEKDGILVAATEVASAHGLLQIEQVAMGSYLLSLEREGYRAQSCPLVLRRNQEIVGRIRLHLANDVPEGFVVVATAQQDDTSDAAGAGPSDFAMALHPVTCAEYLEFLNHLASQDVEDARRRAPRLSPDTGHLWSPRDKSFELPQPERYPWSAKLPVFGISFDDALAYAAFRSQRDGLTYDLPTEAQWERAARGADARVYSWGNEFDNEYCNGFYAREGQPGVVDVHQYPHDCSPYGVRGMVGNVGDWCYLDDPTTAAAEMAAVRGGNWALTGVPLTLSVRRSTAKSYVSDRLGFRLVLKLEEA